MGAPTVSRKDSSDTESLFRALFENAAVGIAVVDARGQFCEVNPRLCRMLGQTADDLLGRTFKTLTHDDEWAGNQALIDELVRGVRDELSMETRYRRDNNIWLWVKVHMTRLGGGRRHGSRLMAVIEDIDARKKSEEDGTEEVLKANTRVRHAERMAVIGTLSAGLGHDMANLLVPVHIRLEALSRMDLTEDAHDHLAAIKSSAEYLQKLSGGLRLLATDPARAAHGGHTDLEAWWADAGGILRTVLPGSASLEVHLPANTWVVMTRPALMQAVINLVQNAGEVLRNQSDGSVVVGATIEDEHVNVTVTDNGPGMSEEVCRRCIEPFFTTKHRSISTGLGLSIVYGLVKEAGGEVEIQSQPGQGTTFTLRLRRSAGPDGAAPDAPRRVAVVQVEDARMRAIVAIELRALRYEVAFDASGASVAPDLMVADRWPLETAEHTKLVLLADDVNPPASAVALGSKPAVQAIRNALRQQAAA